MKIIKRQVGDVVIMDLHGRMVTGEGDVALRAAVTELADPGKAKLLLNLADVSYVDFCSADRLDPHDAGPESAEAAQSPDEDPGPAVQRVADRFETYESRTRRFVASSESPPDAQPGRCA
jgi:hypothetical protein